MPKWSARLIGDRLDLERAAKSFATDESSILREGDEYWLSSPAWDKETDAEVVLEAAKSLTISVNGLCRLVWDDYHLIEADSVEQVNDAGKKMRASSVRRS